LRHEYGRTISMLAEELSAENHELACQIAEVPDSIRGFGPVKQRNAQAARERRHQLMTAWSHKRRRTLAETA